MAEGGGSKYNLEKVHSGYTFDNRTFMILQLQERTLDPLQEHQTILTNATLSKVSDLGFTIVIYENYFLSSGRSKGVPGTRVPPGVQILSFSCRLAHPLLELVPPPTSGKSWIQYCLLFSDF